MGAKHNGLSKTAPAQKGEERRQGAARLADRHETPKTLEAKVRDALQSENIRDARTLVANAEAVLFGHASGQAARPDAAPRSQIAAAKARIAIATGDKAAAHAILVQAIEVDPQTSALRSLMTEVMMATGRASDVRPVLQHLGSDPRRDDQSPDAAGPTARDTSG